MSPTLVAEPKRHGRNPVAQKEAISQAQKVARIQQQVHARRDRLSAQSATLAQQHNEDSENAPESSKKRFRNTVVPLPDHRVDTMATPATASRAAPIPGPVVAASGPDPILGLCFPTGGLSFPTDGPSFPDTNSSFPTTGPSFPNTGLSFPTATPSVSAPPSGDPVPQPSPASDRPTAYTPAAAPSASATKPRTPAAAPVAGPSKPTPAPRDDVAGPSNAVAGPSQSTSSSKSVIAALGRARRGTRRKGPPPDPNRYVDSRAFQLFHNDILRILRRICKRPDQQLNMAAVLQACQRGWDLLHHVNLAKANLYRRVAGEREFGEHDPLPAIQARKGVPQIMEEVNKTYQRLMEAYRARGGTGELPEIVEEQKRRRGPKKRKREAEEDPEEDGDDADHAHGHNHAHGHPHAHDHPRAHDHSHNLVQVPPPLPPSTDSKANARKRAPKRRKESHAAPSAGPSAQADVPPTSVAPDSAVPEVTEEDFMKFILANALAPAPSTTVDASQVPQVDAAPDPYFDFFSAQYEPALPAQTPDASVPGLADSSTNALFNDEEFAAFLKEYLPDDCTLPGLMAPGETTQLQQPEQPAPLDSQQQPALPQQPSLHQSQQPLALDLEQTFSKELFGAQFLPDQDDNLNLFPSHVGIPQHQHHQHQQHQQYQPQPYEALQLPSDNTQTTFPRMSHQMAPNVLERPIHPMPRRRRSQRPRIIHPDFQVPRNASEPSYPPISHNLGLDGAPSQPTLGQAAYPSQVPHVPTAQGAENFDWMGMMGSQFFENPAADMSALNGYASQDFAGMSGILDPLQYGNSVVDESLFYGGAGLGQASG